MFATVQYPWDPNADWSCCCPHEGAWRSEYDEYTLSGWLALDNADWKQRRSWGATMSSVPDRDGQGWALSVGRLVPAAKTAYLHPSKDHAIKLLPQSKAKLWMCCLGLCEMTKEVKFH